MAKNDDLLTVAYAAKKTAMSISWWRSAIRERKVRFVRIGGRVLIPRSVIHDLIKDGTVEPVRNKKRMA
jgi:excisionase family DNA binding protein